MCGFLSSCEDLKLISVSNVLCSSISQHPFTACVFENAVMLMMCEYQSTLYLRLALISVCLSFSSPLVRLFILFLPT